MTRPGAMVGRQRHMAELSRLMLRAATEGRGALVLLGGEAGVGKASLVSAFLAEAARQGVATAAGRCAGPGETRPFGPWFDVAQQLTASGSLDAAALPYPFGDEVAPVSLPDVATALAAHLGARPLVVALEAVHGADPASLELLKYVALRLPTLPVLIIATYVSEQVHRAHPLWLLLPELQRAGALRMALDRLTRHEVLELVQTALPDCADAKGLAWQLFERTEGNALFLTELMDLHAGTHSRPGTVHMALAGRLSRLSSTAQAALQAAAVVGERFGSDLLAAVVDAPSDALAAALDEATAMQVIRPEGERFCFTHPLLREVLLNGLTGPRRRRYHQRTAEALMAAPEPDPTPIALHLSEAGDLRAAGYLLLAGNAALRMGALVQAGQWYAQALELVAEAEHSRPELLLKFGCTLRTADPARAKACWTEAVRTAEAVGDRAVAVWGRHMLLAAGQPALGEWQSAAAWVQAEQGALQFDPRCQALESDLFGRPAGYPRMAALRAQVLLTSGLVDEAQDLVRQTMAGLLPGADLTEFRQMNWRLAQYQNRVDEVVGLGADIVGALVKRHSIDQALEWAGHHLRMLLRCRADSPDDVDAWAARVARLEAEAPARIGLTGPERRSPLGYYQFLRGHWVKAVEALLDYLTRQPTTNEACLRVDAARLQMARGDLAGARTTIAHLAPRLPDAATAPGLPSLAAYLVRAELHLASGEVNEARAWLEGAERLAEQKHVTADRAPLRLAWAEFYQRTGDTARCKAMAQEALLHAGGVNDCLTTIAGRRVLAACCASQRAEDEFTAALDLAERCRFPYEAALVRLARAEYLPASMYARDDLRLARETFARLGAGPALTRAERLLGATGAPAAADLPSGYGDSLPAARHKLH